MSILKSRKSLITKHLFADSLYLLNMRFTQTTNNNPLWSKTYLRQIHTERVNMFSKVAREIWKSSIILTRIVVLHVFAETRVGRK